MSSGYLSDCSAIKDDYIVGYDIGPYYVHQNFIKFCNFVKFVIFVWDRHLYQYTYKESMGALLKLDFAKTGHFLKLQKQTKKNGF